MIESIIERQMKDDPYLVSVGRESVIGGVKRDTASLNQ